MKTVKRYFRVDRKAIGLMRFVFEGYEGIAGITTLDPAAGVVELFIAPGCEPDVDEVLMDIQRWIYMETVDISTVMGEKSCRKMSSGDDVS